MGRHTANAIYQSVDGWLMNDDDDMIDPAFNAYLQSKFDDVEEKRITMKKLKNIIYEDLEGKNKLFNEEMCEMSCLVKNKTKKTSKQISKQISKKMFFVFCFL